MNNFPSIEEVNIILDEIAEELPEDLFTELSQGIILLPEYKVDPEGVDGQYIMGEYERNIMGRHITIYYGSFEKVHSGLSTEELKEKLKDTLQQEFKQHFESLLETKPYFENLL